MSHEKSGLAWGSKTLSQNKKVYSSNYTSGHVGGASRDPDGEAREMAVWQINCCTNVQT